MADQEQPLGIPPPGRQLPLPGAGDGGNRNLLSINIEGEMRRSHLDYAISVIVERALPDIRNGLKPWHRRILYGTHDLGLQLSRPTRKCAKLPGDAMGKYHLTGMRLFTTLVRMVQSFSMRYPTLEGRGNFGFLDGNPPSSSHRPCWMTQLRSGPQVSAHFHRTQLSATLAFDQGLLAAFVAVRRHMAPRGVFAFDVFNPNVSLLARHSSQAKHAVQENAKANAQV